MKHFQHHTYLYLLDGLSFHDPLRIRVNKIGLQIKFLKIASVCVCSIVKKDVQ